MNDKWGKIVCLCDNISSKAEALPEIVDVVVGIARGGVIPASIIARSLQAELDIITCKSYNEDRTRGILQVSEIDNLPNYFQNSVILIVDDICDSGHTLAATKDAFKSKYSSALIYTASLYFKKNDIHTPDIYGEIVSQNDWIEFPWED